MSMGFNNSSDSDVTIVPNEIMIDIETLGLGMNAPIVSIALAIVPDTLVSSERVSVVEYHLDIEEQLKNGRKIDLGTFKFWMGQVHATDYFEQNNKQKRKVRDVLESIATIVEPRDFVWGNGSGFDITMLEQLFRDYNVPIPWSYRNVCDLRTFNRFVGNNEVIRNHTGKHTAKGDAVDQALHVVRYLKRDNNINNKGA